MNRNRIVFSFALVIFSACAAMAQNTPADVRDLVGARAAGGETALTNRGYKFIKTTEGDDRKWSNWWNASKGACLTVVTMNGRYSAITSGPASDCDQGMNTGGGGSTTSTPSDVADLVGARAAGGETQLRARGYRFIKSDNAGEHIFSNWWSRSKNVCLTVATVNGRYDSIVSGPSFDCGVDGNSGVTPPGLNKVDLSDLVGSRAAGGETELQNRGFVMVKTMGLNALWQNRTTVQCVMVTTRNGRYSKIVSSNACPR